MSGGPASGAVTAFTAQPLHWRPYVAPVDLDGASPEQLAALAVTPSHRKISDYVLVLAHDPETLARRTPLFNAIMYGREGLPRGERELAAVGASIVNRCVYCASVHAARFSALTRRPEVIERIFADGPEARLDDAREQAILDLAVRLSRFPPEAAGSDLAALRESGLSDLEILDAILSAAIFGWANRLMHTLGEPLAPAEA